MKVYEVGGCVRDGIMGIEPKDIDYVVVGATPNEMLKLGYKQVGADFPVFLHPTSGDEYALARTERKVGVGYGGFDTDHSSTVTLEDDLFRRDLTMNAIARDIETGELIDPYNGIIDIKQGIIRHTSEAFAEDPVRTLRVARFAARYQFQIDPSTLDLMIDMKEQGEYDHLTAERVWKETEKAVMEQDPMKYFVVLDDVGIIDTLFPHIQLTTSTSFDPSVLSSRNLDVESRLALLGFTEETLKSLKAPSSCIKFVKAWDETAMIRYNMDFSDFEGLFNLFFTFDVFRNANHIKWFIQCVCSTHEFWKPVSILLQNLFNVANAVRFADLSDEVKNGPKTNITGEINQLRICAMKEAMLL